MKNNQKSIQTNIKDFTIRFAVQDDLTLIKEFILALAEYEKLSDSVKIVDVDLDKFLFGDKPLAEVIIGDFQGIPVGFALFYHNFSTFECKPGIYLEDLFVNPDMRGKGFGKIILAFLARLAVERDCARMEWSVLDWNEPAIDFYVSIGAEIKREWLLNRLTAKNLIDFANNFK